MAEIGINYCAEDAAMHVSTDDRKWVTRMRKLAEAHPDAVRIIAEPETNGGYFTLDIPKCWLRISPPKKLDLSDEQRAEIAERLAKGRSI